MLYLYHIPTAHSVIVNTASPKKAAEILMNDTEYFDVTTFDEYRRDPKGLINLLADLEIVHLEFKNDIAVIA